MVATNDPLFLIININNLINQMKGICRIVTNNVYQKFANPLLYIITSSFEEIKDCCHDW